MSPQRFGNYCSGKRQPDVQTLVVIATALALEVGDLTGHAVSGGFSEAAARLRLARIRAGYSTAKEAAVAIGISAATYISHENGSRSFAQDQGQRYERFFNLPVGSLTRVPEAHAMNKERVESINDEDAKCRGGFSDLFDLDTFLHRILEKAGSKSAMARVLDLPASRVIEMFSGRRRVTMEEGMALAAAYGVPPAVEPRTDSLNSALVAGLRHPPKGGWTDKHVERLADKIRYGLTLLQAPVSTSLSSDAIEIAARAIADRFPE